MRMLDERTFEERADKSSRSFPMRRLCCELGQPERMVKFLKARPVQSDSPSAVLSPAAAAHHGGQGYGSPGPFRGALLVSVEPSDQPCHARLRLVDVTPPNASFWHCHSPAPLSSRVARRGAPGTWSTTSCRLLPTADARNSREVDALFASPRSGGVAFLALFRYR